MSILLGDVITLGGGGGGGNSNEVIISDTQPTETDNKLWVKESSSSDGISIPTMSDVSVIENTLNQLDRNMAYVESGNTASRAYTYGQFISWKGVLYTVSDTNGISSGVSFSTGSSGNLTAVVDRNGDDCGGLNSLNEKTIYIHASWTGNIVSGQDNISWNSMQMTVPSGYTPIRAIPYAENQSSMWYQIMFSAWGDSNKGLIYRSGYAWGGLTIDFVVECMKTTDFEAAKSR